MKHRAKIGPESDSEWQRQEKRQKTLLATSPDGLFRSRTRFWSILGSRPDPQNHQTSSLCLLREPPWRPVYKLREALGSLEASGERFYVDFGCSGCLPGAMFGAPGASWERFWRKFSMLFQVAFPCQCYLLLASSYLLLATSYLLLATCYTLPTNCYSLFAMCCLRLATWYLLPATSKDLLLKHLRPAQEGPPALAFASAVIPGMRVVRRVGGENMKNHAFYREDPVDQPAELR